MSCLHCGETLAIKPRGRKRKYCSTYCRNRAWDKQNPELKQAQVQRRQQKQRQKTQLKYAEMPAVPCIICHRTIDPASVNRGAEVCSGQCSIKRNTAKRTPEQIRVIKERQKAKDPHRFKDQAQKTKAKRLGRYKSPVYRAKIYERDSYTCQLCDSPLEMRATVPKHPKASCCETWCYLAPTIDHITPLANGGWHEPRNVQAAHFICNSKKSNKSEKLNA